jgi:hypothetical protein
MTKRRRLLARFSGLLEEIGALLDVFIALYLVDSGD